MVNKLEEESRYFLNWKKNIYTLDEAICVIIGHFKYINS